MDVLYLLSFFDDDLSVFIKTQAHKMNQTVVAYVLQVALKGLLS